jgi:hypothetical protein
MPGVEKTDCFGCEPAKGGRANGEGEVLYMHGSTL